MILRFHSLIKIYDNLEIKTTFNLRAYKNQGNLQINYLSIGKEEKLQVQLEGLGWLLTEEHQMIQQYIQK